MPTPSLAFSLSEHHRAHERDDVVLTAFGVEDEPVHAIVFVRQFTVERVNPSVSHIQEHRIIEWQYRFRLNRRISFGRRIDDGRLLDRDLRAHVVRVVETVENPVQPAARNSER